MTDDAGMIGKKIGQYTITALLGTGGMASVYRARQESVSRDVAIKVMATNLAQNPEFIQRFQREARTFAGLDHPNIVKLFDYGQSDSLVYLVMQLMTGGSLLQQVVRGPLPLDRVAKITQQLADALDYAHEQGLIHRDLKPANILLDARGNALLTDFGIAKLVTQDSVNLTATGLVMGTPTYMSPEQWQGAVLDARSDLYALGIIIYEMLAGQTPFRADTPFALMHKHVFEPPTPVQTYRPDVPTRVEYVLSRALAKNPIDRFGTGTELAINLIEALGVQPAGSSRQHAIPPDATSPYLSAVTPSSVQAAGTGSGSSSLQQPTYVGGAEGAGGTGSGARSGSVRSDGTYSYPTMTPAAKRGLNPRVLVIGVAVVAVIGIALFILANAIGGGGTGGSTDTPPPATTQAIAVNPTEENGGTTPTAVVIGANTDTPTERPTDVPVVIATDVPTDVATEVATEAATDAPAVTEVVAVVTETEPTPGVITIVENTATPTLSPEPTETPDVEATTRFEQALTAVVEQTLTAQAVASFTLTPSYTPTEKPTATPTDTFTPPPTSTDTPTPTDTFTPTATTTPTPTLTFTPSPTPAPTDTPTPTRVPPGPITAQNAAFVEEVGVLGKGTLDSIGWSSQGDIAISGGFGITLFPHDGGAPVKLEGHRALVGRIVFSPDGTMLGSVDKDGSIWLHAIPSGEQIRKLGEFPGEMQAVAFSPDNKLLATGGLDQVVRLWNVETGALIFELRGHQGRPWAAAFSPDGTVLATAGADAVVRLWNVRTATQVGLLTGHTNFVFDLSFSPDGTRLASASRDTTVRVWNLASQTQVLQLPHDRDVWAVHFTPDSASLLTASWDRNLRLWNANSGELIRTFSGHRGEITYAALSSDGGRAASISYDGTVRIWNLATGEGEIYLDGYSATYYGIAVSADGSMMAAASWDRRAHVFNTLTRQKISDSEVELAASGFDVAFSPDGRSLAFVGGGDRIYLIDPLTGQTQLELQRTGYQTQTVAFSPDGKLLAVGVFTSETEVNDVWLYDLENGRWRDPLSKHVSVIWGVAFSPDGSLLASVGRDGATHLWDVQTGELVKSLSTSSGEIIGVAFSHSGSYIATAGGDRIVRLWDVATGSLVWLVSDFPEFNTRISFSADDSVIAVTNATGTVSLIDVQLGTRIALLSGQGFVAEDVAFTPDGKLLASAGWDGLIRLWGIPE